MTYEKNITNLTQSLSKQRNIFLEKLCLKIKDRRIELGLTQRELAEKSNLSINMINRLEKRERSLSIPTLICLSYGLELSMKDLMPEFTAGDVK